MTILNFTDAGLEKIESYVSTLPGVSRCSMLRRDDGTPTGLWVVLKPGRSPVQMPTEISSFLDEVLDIQIGPERIEVEVTPRDGDRTGQEGFWAGGGRRGREVPTNAGDGAGEEKAPSRGASAGIAPPPARPLARGVPEGRGAKRRAGDRRNGEPRGRDRRTERRRKSERRESRSTSAPDAPASEGAELPASAAGRGAPARPPAAGPRNRERAPRTPDAASAIRLDRYAIFGGGGGGVELRIRVAAGSSTHDAALRTSSLAELTAAEVVDATLRAAEKAVDRLPVDARSERILVLEANDVEDVTLRSGAFVAVTVLARRRGGPAEATGLRRGSSDEPEAAARAALDAVRQFLEGPDGDGEARDAGDGPPGAGEVYDPFAVWD